MQGEETCLGISIAECCKICPIGTIITCLKISDPQTFTCFKLNKWKVVEQLFIITNLKQRSQFQLARVLRPPGVPQNIIIDSFKRTAYLTTFFLYQDLGNEALISKDLIH